LDALVVNIDAEAVVRKIDALIVDKNLIRIAV
jgi:hypothetical protein